MGTRVRIVVEGVSRPEALRLSEFSLREIERVELLLSSWDPESELAKLNAAPVGRAVELSTELSSALSEVERWTAVTNRAFDARIGALIDEWGVRGGERAPTARELTQAIAATGLGALELRGRVGVRRSRRGWVDSGAFGKGFALREIERRIEREGDARLLVDLGGQIWAHAPSGEPWRVDVAHPLERGRSAAGLRVHGVSVATSGTSERPGHLLDPRTGRPAPAWGTVTVVSADPMEADVLSTALYVMGPEHGLAWAGDAAVAALFLQVEDAGLRITWTPEMERWMDEHHEGIDELEHKGES